MNYLYAFLIGGALCIPAQILIDKTKLTNARILTIYVVSGVVLSGVGIYEKLAKLFGAGATVPLTGFGNALAKGVRAAVDEKGLLGVITGGLTGTPAGLTAALFFSLICSLCFKSRQK